MDNNVKNKTALVLNRRAFLKTTGSGLAFAITLGSGRVFAQKFEGKVAEKMIGPWVKIHTDGRVLIYNPAAEMGQGSMTALPAILAEEMDADWSSVYIEHSPIEATVYGRSWRPGGPGNMMTVGSQAVRGYFMRLRQAGAQIRRVLMENAATHWNVSVEGLTTEPGVVIDAGNNRRLTYGEIAAFAVPPDELPAITNRALKKPREFRLIGRSLPRHDVPAKANGTALFAMDVRVPDMVYAMLERSPRHGGRLGSFNKAEIEAMPGIVHTIELRYGVGLIGTSIEEVIKAKKALKVEWKGGSTKDLNSEAKLAEYAKIATDNLVEARSVVDEGDAVSAMQSATHTYSADYYSDHVYHAQMEPLCAVASVSAAGDRAEVWVGTQNTAGARDDVAKALNISTEKVTLHPCYLGGGFGRRSTSDYLLEAVKLSKAVSRPVKLIWTREDDLRYGMYRPMNLQRLEAGANDAGDIVAWTHCVIGDGGGLLTSGIKNEFYELPNQKIELCSVGTGVRLKHWRAVGHGFNKFAIESFIDEIAADRNVDPYEYRRTLMRNEPEARAVVEAVAEMANWGRSMPEGRALGMAFGERSGALAAGVAEISVDTSTGKIRVHHFWCAVNAGIIVQPDNATAQIEGGVVTGLSSVLHERVTLKDGIVEQSNFHDYPVLRMADMPAIDVQFMKSDKRPEGLGEASTPIVAGAVANAFASH